MAVYVMSLRYICMSALILMFVQGQPIQLFVKENQPSGTSLGFVTRGADFLDTLELSQKTDLRYKILTQGNAWADYFLVNEGTGEIQTAAVLNREILCPDQKENCQLDIDVAIHSETFLRLFRVQITITDVNDNAPEFAEAEVMVKIPESSPIGFTVPIRGATDKDSGTSHGVQSYEIIPSDGQFTVSVIQNLDGTPEVGIVVNRKLDREITSSHTIEIVAKDGGVPPKTGRVKVTIVVLDDNDHSPRFTHSVYNVSVEESVPINALVTRVKATDKDIGDNGQIKYRFSSRTISKFPNVFNINGVSGELKINGSIDYEKRREYRLVVEAVDQGSPKLTAQALVILTVKDINDNSPQINFNFLSESDKAELSENSTKDDFVAHISVTDLDSGQNSVVDCRTETELFKIERLYHNEFQVLLNTIFDREITAEITVTVTCTDNGQPALTESRPFKLVILDENDNHPKFIIPRYTVTVREDFHVGDSIITVMAKDADSSDNGKVLYSMQGEYKDYFIIDSASGLIKLYQPLDFDSVRKFKVNVEARDGGSPSRSSTAVIDVNLIDVNDELPVFNETSYFFQVEENSPNGTLIGSVQAHDPDYSFGGKVAYSLVADSTETHFRIDQDGRIWTLGPIDRETTAEVTMTVLAMDLNDSSQISKAEVQIQLLDINDNRPIITFPNEVNNTVIIAENTHGGRVPFATVLATDADFQENQTLVYEIKNTELEQTFHIDSENGSIMFLSNDYERMERQYTIDVVVRDSGVPQLETSSRLHVIVLYRSLDSSETPAIASNTLAVIIVVSLTSVISIVIIICIYIVRRTIQKTDRSAQPTYTSDRKYDEKTEASIINNPAKSNTEGVENKTTSMIADDTLLEKKKGFCGTRGTSTGNPPDIFDLSQHGNAGIWLNYLRQNEHLIPRTSSTNSGYTGKSFSQMSLDTLTSDSGRGGSELDSQENINNRELVSSFQQKNHRLDCTDSHGDYMDMQRSRLSSISTGDTYSGPPTPSQTYSQMLGLSSFRTPHSPGESLFKGSNSSAQNIKPYQECRQTKKTLCGNEAPQLQVACRDVPQVTEDIVKDSYQYNMANPRHPSVSDTDDSETKTSGSYTVHMGELVEFDGNAGITL